MPLTTVRHGPLRTAAPPCAERCAQCSGVSHNPLHDRQPEAQGGEVTSQGHHCTLSPPCRAGVLTAPLFAWVGAPPHSPEHPIMHTVAGRQWTPFLDPAELGAWVAGHDAVELHAGPYTLSLQLRRDLDCGCGSCWCGRGRERARGACGDRHEVVRVCVCV